MRPTLNHFTAADGSTVTVTTHINGEALMVKIFHGDKNTPHTLVVRQSLPLRPGVTSAEIRRREETSADV